MTFVQNYPLIVLRRGIKISMRNLLRVVRIALNLVWILTLHSLGIDTTTPKKEAN